MKVKKWELDLLIEKQVVKAVSGLGPQIQAIVKETVSKEIKTLEKLMKEEIEKQVSAIFKKDATVTDLKNPKPKSSD